MSDTMQFRKTKKADLPAVMAIIADAKAYLKAQGSPQWQNGYGPNEEVILADLAQDASYVLVIDDQVVGTAALIVYDDPAYRKLAGTWLVDQVPYLAIHHVAVSQKIRGKGLGERLLRESIAQGIRLGFFDIRIDTYPANTPMLNLIEKVGFTYCGMIKFDYPNGERKAFQLIADRNL